MSAVGMPVPRVDARDKVTGRAVYPTDVYLPDMLHLRLVRVHVPQGVIKRIDVGRAREMPGVEVFTAVDVPCNSFGSIKKDQPVLASERVRFWGEPVALVAAPDPCTAARAAAAVDVEVVPLPVVEAPEQALDPGAPAVHPDGNLCHEIHYQRGDVDSLMAAADLVLEDRFEVPFVDHVCMEPEGGVAYWEDGVLTLWVGTQNPFYDRAEVSRVLGIPPERVRVLCPCTGGGFGGKDGNTVQLYLALAAWKTGRPCRLVLSRMESLTTSYKRHGAVIYARVGLTSEGRLLAYEGRLYYDTGAYAALGPAVLGLAAEHCPGPYRYEGVRVNAYLVYTNKPPASAMRGFGAPQAAFAIETLLNRAARALGLDPIELRLRNALGRGDIAPLGHRLEHGFGLREALLGLKESPLWQERQRRDQDTGYGMAVGYLSCGMGKGIPDRATVEIVEDPPGRFLVRVGFVDIGQGNTTAFAQIAAAALGVAVDQVEVVMADTARTFDCGSTAASRSTYMAGNAILAAAAQLRSQKGSRRRAVASSVFPEVEGFGIGPGFPHALYSCIAQAVKVRLDRLTGAVALEGVYGVTEAGRVINPVVLEGQIVGGVAMGAGYALWEKLDFPSGIPAQRTLSEYLIPTALDLPDILTSTVELPEESGPYGAKGCAEIGAIAIAPAVAGALLDLLGWAPKSLPLDREVLRQVAQRQVASGEGKT